MKKIDKSKVPVVILCGGFGTRMKEETEYIPKPLVEVGGMPLMVHIMNIYYSHGFSKFVLPLGYKGMKIKEYFLNYKYQNNFRLNPTPTVLYVSLYLKLVKVVSLYSVKV